jgi:hypothetical protein
MEKGPPSDSFKNFSPWPGISLLAVIAGNPKANRHVCGAVIGLILLTLLICLLLARRKKTNPENAPPLHPATLSRTGAAHHGSELAERKRLLRRSRS